MTRLGLLLGERRLSGVASAGVLLQTSLEGGVLRSFSKAATPEERDKP